MDVSTPAPAAASAAAPAAPASPPPAASTPAASSPEVRSEDDRFDAALAKIAGKANDKPAEPPPAAAAEAEGEKPPEEPPAPEAPPRVALATKRLEQAKAKEAAALAREKDVEAREKHLEGEVKRIRDIVDGARPAFDLGKSLLAAKGDANAILDALAAAGIELPATAIAARVVQGDPREQPLTRKELEAIEADREAKRQKAADEAAAKTRQLDEAAHKAAVAASQKVFVELATAERAPTTAKALARFGAAGRELVIERAYQAQLERQGRREPCTHEAILADVETKLRAEFPEWAPAMAPAAPTTPEPAAKKPTAISNGAAARTTPPRPLTETERWEKFEQKHQGARNLNGRCKQHDPRASDR